VKTIAQHIERRLQSESNVWVATVRPDGRPHLTPVWFVWHAGRAYLCIGPNSVKARNLAHNSRVALALEDGSQPVILEGTGRPIDRPDWPPEVIDGFKRKYDWNIAADGDYGFVVEVTPGKYLNWS
jgi:hypothetical protein